MRAEGDRELCLGRIRKLACSPHAYAVRDAILWCPSTELLSLQ